MYLSEYDALAKVIQHHPDRHETLKELEALGKELEHLSHIKESVEDKVFAYDIISLCVLYWFIDHLCINFFSY